MKILEQSPRALPKDLICSLPMQDLEDGGSEDLLSRLLVHAGPRDGANYKGGAAVRRRQNPNSS